MFKVFQLFNIVQCSLYVKGSAVKVFNSEDFNKIVAKEELPLFVEFYADWCGHCKALAPKLEKVAKALKGIVRVIAINEAQSKDLMGKFQIQGFPTLKFFNDNRATPIDYQGPREVKDMVNFIKKQVWTTIKDRLEGKGGSSGSGDKKKKEKKPSAVVQLTDTNFNDLVMKNEDEAWMVEFYSPNCGYCKMLEPEWERAAKSLAGKVKFGKVDCTKENILARRFQIEGFPTIKAFPKGKKDDKLAKEYKEERKASSLERFASKLAQEEVKIVQITNNEVFTEKCENSLCLIAFLPHISESKAEKRKKYLESFKKAAQANSELPMQFLWAQGADSFDLEQALNLAFGYPALIGIRLNKGKFTVHRGQFTDEAIRSFITSLTTTGASMFDLPKNLPKFESVKEWDGKDEPENSAEL